MRHPNSSHPRTAPVALNLTLVLLLISTPLLSQEIGFENARLVDPATREIHEGAILVRNGVIVAVESTLPSGFAGTRVDLEGRWVIPGLVDMHTHSLGNQGPGSPPQLMGVDGVARVDLYAGVVAFLDLFSPEDLIFQFRDSQRAEHRVGAEVFAAGTCLTATSGHCSEYGVPTRIVDSPEDAAREIDALALKKPDVVKLVYDHQTYGGTSMPTVDRETLNAVVAEAARHAFKTVVHVGTWDDLRHAVLAGAAAVTHTPGSSMPADLPRLMAENGTVHIPTLAVQSDLARFVDDPSMLDDAFLNAMTTEALLTGYRVPIDAGNPFASWLDSQRANAQTNQNDVRALAAAGVTMLTGTDGGNLGVFQGFSVHREMELLVEAGLSEWDALRAATTNAATFLDQPWGLGPGNEATFVVLDESPIDDIRNTRLIHAVVQRGTVVNREALRVR